MSNPIPILEKILVAAGGMFWEMFWALVLGLTLSAMTQTFVSRRRLSGLLGNAGPKELSLAAFLGALSSSCSYAAAAMSRSLFQKGAHIISAFAFMFASTNLVIELGLVLWSLLGWQFVVAEFLGGILLIGIMAVLMRWFGPIGEFAALQRSQEEKAAPAAGHCCHAAQSVDDTDSPRTIKGWQKTARAFVSEWKMIGKEVLIGTLISGALMELVPHSVWQTLFLGTPGQPLTLGQSLENAAVGPLVSMLSFVCSVGNIPVAMALYHHGISFGGAISFIYADLIVIPLILIYRRYYGTKLALWSTLIFYFSMVLTGFLVELLFSWFHLIPPPPPAMVQMGFFRINYTLWLNLVALLVVLAGVGLARKPLAQSGFPEKG